ncbi:hypothetical protein AB0C76_15195 [Kitasatospora sp. NPDC048722]|uniref:hypothetical protein n=1 Tax=Kitasatospora sp. NPDC048722 TaxID=3155639 RepID=UPI0033E6A26C
MRVAPLTLERLVQPVVEICDFSGVVPWRLTAREIDRYFADPGKRAHATARTKMNGIDGYFAFLGQRYAGEIATKENTSQMRQDRILDEAAVTADPLHLMRLSGIGESAAMRYVSAAHPEKTGLLPR